MEFRAEWDEFVSDNFVPDGVPFTGMNEASALRLAGEIFEQLGIDDTISAEINVKVRDEETNLNNRKYNFGNF